MKQFFTIAILLLLSLGVKAQQDPMFTQFFCNKLFQNPAYTGSTDGINALALYRTQWVGFDGAPTTYLFSIHAPILRKTSGIGLAVARDQIGINDIFIANLSYAFRIDFGVGRLAMGINGKMYRYQMEWSRTSPLEQLDDFIPYTDNDLFLVNFGTGLYFDTDRFYVGVSVPKLLENEMDFNDNKVNATSAKQRRHYFMMAGAAFTVHPKIVLKPALQFKYVKNAPFEADVNLSVLLYNTFLIGTTYRTGDSFDAIAQVYINDQICIGYAHDFTLTKLSNHHKGTHEILLSIDFGRKPKGFDHPRYF